MDENLVVYETVRNEILRVQESTTNETIYMYVAYITLFSIGFSYNWVFLASFIVLIVFQALINKDWWEMRKCSIFIRTFFVAMQLFFIFPTSVPSNSRLLPIMLQAMSILTSYPILLWHMYYQSMFLKSIRQV